MQLVLILQERDGDGMNRRVAPAFVVKPACGVEEVEIGLVGWTPEEGHVGDFEIRPDYGWMDWLEIGIDGRGNGKRRTVTSVVRRSIIR